MSELSPIGQAASIAQVKISTQVAGFALLLYDSVLTLPEEVNYVWRKKIRLGAIFYFCSKYGLIASICSTISLNTSALSSVNVCNSILAFANIAFGTSQIGHWGLAVLRGYALAHPKKLWKTILISSSLLFIVGSILSIWFSLPCYGELNLWRYIAQNYTGLLQYFLLVVMEAITLGFILLQTRRDFRNIMSDIQQPTVSFVSICRQQSMSQKSKVTYQARSGSVRPSGEGDLIRLVRSKAFVRLVRLA